jgi:hypothetical protein
MTLRRLLSQTATVLTHSNGTADDYGNSTPGYSAGTDYPCRLELRTSDENRSDRDTQLTGLWLVLEPDAVIDGHDRVRVDGITYEVNGPPMMQATNRAQSHIEVNLRRAS